MQRTEPARLSTYRVVGASVERDMQTGIPWQKMLQKTPWLIVASCFFMGRAVLFQEMLPLGVAFLAALRLERDRSELGLAFLALLAGILSTTGSIDVWPYVALSVLAWLPGPKWATARNFWVAFLPVGFVLLKAPLHFLTAGSTAVWMISVLEAGAAVLAYSIFASILKETSSGKIAHREVQGLLLLASVLVGADLTLFHLSLRHSVGFFLVITAAGVGGFSLSSVTSSALAVLALLMGETSNLPIYLVCVGLLSGALRNIPGGIALGAVIGWLVAAGFPIDASEVPRLLEIGLAGLAAVIVPASYLKQIERVIPGTERFVARQLGQSEQRQEVFRSKLKYLSGLFAEVAAMIDTPTHSIAAKQLAGAAEIVARLGEEFDGKVAFAEEMEAKLLQSMGNLPVAHLTVVKGSDGYEVYGALEKPCGGIGRCREVAKHCSAVLGRSYDVISRQCGRRGGCSFRIYPRPRYRLEIKTAQVAQQRVSGDNKLAFELSTGRIALLLSDGMGVGPRAAEKSSTTINLLEKMIRAGYNREFAVNIINQILLMRNNEEVFATVDLVISDLQNGDLEFIKIGAAPSFIKRANRVEVVYNAALPIGILEDVDVQPERRSLQKGEFLIMVTDGILDAQREMVHQDRWMANLLERIDPQISCGELAHLLLSESIRAAHGEVNDDMMIVVARLVDNQDEIQAYRRN